MKRYNNARFALPYLAQQKYLFIFLLHFFSDFDFFFKSLWYIFLSVQRTESYCFNHAFLSTAQHQIKLSMPCLCTFASDSSEVCLCSRHLFVQVQQQKHWKKGRKRYEICLKLTIKTQVWRHWHSSGVFIVNFERTSRIFLVFLLMTLNR